MRNLSPIILFTYNRLNTLKKCISSLKKNSLSKYSKIYIFSDAPKNSNQINKVEIVRKYIRKIHGFKKKKIFYRKVNYGLAKNIISGVTEILNKEKKAIILEDDLIFSKNFLFFMNKALNYYEKKEKVFHISGWNYNVTPNIDEDCFFTRGMNCWGWATWKNRWKHFEKNPDKIARNWKKEKIKKFNFDNSYNFFSQIIRNKKRTLNSWAIFWYASIFNKKKLCLNPKISLTQNIGIGKKSTNTTKIEKVFNTRLKNKKIFKLKFPDEISENLIVFNLIKGEFNKNQKASFLKKLFFYTNDKKNFKKN